MATQKQAQEVDDFAIVLIHGQDLKQLLYFANQLGAGISPRGEACFDWGKALHRIIEESEIGI